MSEFTTSWLLKLGDIVSGPLKKVNAAVAGSQETFDKLTAAVGNVTEKMGTLNTMGARVNQRVDAMNEKFYATKSSAEGAATGLDKFTTNLLKFTLANQALNQIKTGFNDLVTPGMEYETEMTKLHIQTNATGKALQEMGSIAEAASGKFNLSTVGIEKGMETIIGLRPEMKNDPMGLRSMTNDASGLAKLLNDDVLGATKAVTNGLDAFGVKTNQTALGARILSNTLAKLALINPNDAEGAMAAFERAGPMAAQQGWSITQTGAAIGTMMQGGLSAQIAAMGMEQMDKFLTKSDFTKKLQKSGANMNIIGNPNVDIVSRLTELKKLQDKGMLPGVGIDARALKGITVLLDHLDEFKAMNAEMQKTNTLEKAWADLQNTQAEKLKSFNTWLMNVKINLSKYTYGLSAYIGIGMDAIASTAMFALGLTSILSLTKMLGATKMWAWLSSGISLMRTWVLTTAMWVWEIGVAGVTAIWEFIAGITVAALEMVGLNLEMDAFAVAAMASFGGVALAVGAVLGAMIVVANYGPQWADSIGAAIDTAKQKLFDLAPNFTIVLREIVNAVITFFQNAMAGIAIGAISVYDSLPFGDSFHAKNAAAVKSVSDWYSRGKTERDFDVASMKMTRDDKSKEGSDAQLNLQKQLDRATHPDSMAAGEADVNGGGKIRNVIVNIHSLINEFKQTVEGSKMSMPQLKEMVTKLLVEAVRDSELLLGSE